MPFAARLTRQNGTFSKRHSICSGSEAVGTQIKQHTFGAGSIVYEKAAYGRCQLIWLPLVGSGDNAIRHLQYARILVFHVFHTCTANLFGTDCYLF